MLSASSLLKGGWKQRKLLVVGAGGIGCELLKNLVQTGFSHIEVVDEDTIELSNLNRQLLFRQEHVGMPKADIARQALLELNAAAHITSWHANIKDGGRFPLSWFRGFDLVFNALDNVEARRHVNQCCMTVNVDLIESGTEGYLGQVVPIRRGKAECYDCSPKPSEQKTFPVCTIRQTPSKPVHCVVWAKDVLLDQLYGEDLARPNDELSQDEWSRVHQDTLSLRSLLNDTGNGPRLIFEKVFMQDIEYLASNEKLWEGRKKPHPLSLEALNNFSLVRIPDHQVGDLTFQLCLFLDSLETLNKRPERPINFDKDDQDTLDFVTSAANLRAGCFDLQLQSQFSIKAIAGNIIPAVATTNAIVAGLMVVEAIKMLTDQFNKCRRLTVSYGGNRDRCISATKLEAPNPDCVVCKAGKFPLLSIPLNLEVDTLDDLIKIIKKEWKLPPETGLSILHNQRLLYDEDFDDNGPKVLNQLNLGNGDSLMIKLDLEWSTVSLVHQAKTAVKRTAAERGEEGEGGGLTMGKDEFNGFLPINKPAGISSYDVIRQIKQLFPNSKKRKQLPKIGHGGTLDPMASGVLVVAMGKATKQLNQLLLHVDKVYEAVGLFGTETDTEDAQGQVIKQVEEWPQEPEVLLEALERFKGKQQQLPSFYSALKMDGKKLYEYARSGEALPREIEAREVEIYELELLEFTTCHDYHSTAPIFRLRIRCSSGTYVRALVRDIARSLGSAAHLVKLVRIQQGPVLLARDTMELEELKDLKMLKSRLKDLLN